MTASISWVLGRGGLLGQHTERALANVGEVWRPARSLTWASQDVASQLTAAVGEFVGQIGGRPWRVAWCAGAGTVSSNEQSLRFESWVLDRLLKELHNSIAAGRLGVGALFFASSAGALYAGSHDPPFDEYTAPMPLAPYGREKLAQEQAIARWSAQTGTPSLLGRIANLYGPGQDLAKSQGLISQLCWTQLLQRPLTIYVPLSTMRDYVYAPDCARMIASGLDVVANGDGASKCEAHTKVLASQRSISIGAVLGEFRRVLRRNARVSMRSSPLARHQVRDLRLRSRTMADVDRHASTPFPVGLHATYHDLRSRFATSS